MRLFPKVLLKWIEPPNVGAARELLSWKQMPSWRKAALAFILSSLLMLIWWMAGFNPNNQRASLTTALVVAYALPLVGIYGLPILLNQSFAGSWWAFRVYVTHRGVGNTSGSYYTNRYDQIQSCRIESKPAGNHFSLLCLEMRDKRTCIYGVPPEIDLAVLANVLRGQGLEVHFEGR